MEKALQLLLILGCLVFLQVQGYTLRDRVFGRFPRPRLEDFLRNKRLYEVSDESENSCEDHPQVDCFVIESFESPEDYCKENKDFAETYCRKTCNIDDCATKLGTPKIPAPPRPGEIEPCRDRASDCKSLIATESPSGCGMFAHKQAYLEYYCRRSCNLCH